MPSMSRTISLRDQGPPPASRCRSHSGNAGQALPRANSTAAPPFGSHKRTLRFGRPRVNVMACHSDSDVASTSALDVGAPSCQSCAPTSRCPDVPASCLLPARTRSWKFARIGLADHAFCQCPPHTVWQRDGSYRNPRGRLPSETALNPSLRVRAIVVSILPDGGVPRADPSLREGM